MKEITPVKALTNSLEALLPEFRSLRPNEKEVKELITIMGTAAMKNEKLLQAERNSFFLAARQCIQTGLKPDSREAVLVPRWDKKKKLFNVQYMEMVYGITKRLYATGKVLNHHIELAFENDPLFEYTVGPTGPEVNHKVLVNGDRGTLISAYAIVWTKEGGRFVEVMGLDEIKAAKDASQGGDYGPWNGAFKNEMAKKTVFKRLCKRLPFSDEIDLSWDYNDNLSEEEQEEHSEPRDVAPPQKKQPQSKGLKDLAGKFSDTIEPIEVETPEPKEEIPL